MPEHEPEILAAKRRQKFKPVRVYMAGPVVDEDSTAGWPRTGQGPSEEEPECPMVTGWRDVIFYSKHGDLEPGQISRSKNFVYAGPTITTMGHGMVDRSEKDQHLAQRCLGQIKQCDVVFAWIDREATVGTIVEITYARSIGVPVFLVFKTDELSRYFYFVAQIAGRWEIASSIDEAWRIFRFYLDSTPKSFIGKSN
jgi:Nucleoside 2-deoxyribosyltransferase